MEAAVEAPIPPIEETDRDQLKTENSLEKEEMKDDSHENVTNGVATNSALQDDTHNNVSSQRNVLNNANETDQPKLDDDNEDDNDSSDDDDDVEDEEDEDKGDPYSFSDTEDMPTRPSDLIKGESAAASERSAQPRSDSGLDDLDADDEDRLVINEDLDVDLKRDHLTLKEKVLNLKSDKPRKKHLRFNGMPEEEVAKKLLPDLIKDNLDILMIGINPGLYAAFKGHHYAGPGNHFWKCMFLGGLTPKSMCADDDHKLLEHGIGFTNVVMRATRGNANLTRKEIEEGSQLLIDKIKKFKPRIAVFNGKGIYEVFSGKKEFHFGKQPDRIEDTDTHAWVMPNSSARCAQLPRAVDKVPFYAALKKFRDYLRGEISEIDETEVVFTDIKLKSFHESSSPKLTKMNSEFKILDHSDAEGSDLSVDVRVDPITGKKRRGRPPKPRADGTLPPPKRRVVLDENGRPVPRGSNPIDPATGRKKRGRPKKADMLAAQASFESIKDAKRDSIDSAEAFLEAASVADEKTVEAVSVQPPSNQPVQPLPPFSPNFGRSSALHSTTTDEGLEDGSGLKSEDLNSGCDHSQTPTEAENFGQPGVPHEQAMQSSPNVVPPSSQQAPPHQHHHYGFGASPGHSHAAQGTPPHAPNGTNSNNPTSYKSFSPNFNYNNGSPLHSAGLKAAQQTTAVAAGSPSIRSGADDVTTKSISGLESLVDQIPAIAENDSGVFSGSGAGSHPNTPRSVGPYSPATGGSNFHTSPFHTPNTLNHFSSVPNNSDASPSVTENSTNYHHPPTDFSVNSLVHQQQRVSAAVSDMATAPPVSSFIDSSSFSVSSLTSSTSSSYDMAAKYANNPYTSSFLSAGPAGFNAGSFFGQPNSFAGSMGSPMTPHMAGMASMHGAMSYYGQYSNSYGAAGTAAAAGAAAAAGFAPSPYSAYMPNPGYPYSHYGQNPYSQSPYF